MKTNLILFLQTLIKRKIHILAPLLAPCVMLVLLGSTHFTYSPDTMAEQPAIAASAQSTDMPEIAPKSGEIVQVPETVDKKIDPAGAPEATKTSRKKTKKDPTKTITFRYNNENLVDVINFLAAQKECNILLPQGADAITNKVTISIDEKVSLAQAWEMLDVILGIAGYSMLPKGDTFVIKKNTDALSRELSKLYVGTKPEDLPNTEEQIQYLYFLSNAKVTDDANNDLNKLLSELMPKESYKVDPSTNGIIFSAKANLIRSIMRIVAELDKPGFAEKLAVIHLRHASSELLAKLFTENIIKTAADSFDRYRFDAKKQSDANYFSKNVKIIPETRTNSLIVLGKAQAVERIQDFIYKYIDVELESGKSILHIYQLQYLEADKAKEALDKVVESAKATAGTGQAKGAPVNQTGTQRTFGDVIIQTDATSLSQGTAPAGGTEGAGSESVFGGNKLIIAARNDDWIVLKELLEKLDQPQPQVLLEVIIADLTLDDFKQLGASLRNPVKIPLPNDVQYQSGLAPNGAGLILDPTQNNPKTINADLLGINLPAGDKPTHSQAFEADEGSTVFSFNDNDGRTWCVAQILKSVNAKKILSAPHVLATNNQEALVRLGESRNLRDESVGTAGSTTVKRKWVNAYLEVKLKPRISSEAQSVTMQVSINIEQYNSDQASDRTTRTVITNATVHDKDILAIGGLLRTDVKDTIQKTPILGDIPLLGWFLKGRNTTYNKANLTVFIQPIIIHPYLRGGVSPETQKYVKLMKASAQEGDLFDSVKDPVTRVFFKSGTENAETEIKKFVEKNQAKKLEPLIMGQNAVPPAMQPQVVTLASTLKPIKEVVRAENKTAKAPTPAPAQATAQAQKNPSVQTSAPTPAQLAHTAPTKAVPAMPAGTPAPTEHTTIPIQQTAIAPRAVQTASKHTSERADKIKELIKNEENPLRRVHG